MAFSTNINELIMAQGQLLFHKIYLKLNMFHIFNIVSEELSFFFYTGGHPVGTSFNETIAEQI